MTALAASAVLLAGLCFTGLSFAALLALERGAAAYGAGYSSRASRAFEDLFLFIPPRRLAEMAWIAAAAVAALAFLALGGVAGRPAAILARAAAAAAAGALTLLAPSRLVVLLRARRRARIEAQLETALVDMGGALRSGFSIVQAVERVVEDGEGPLAEEFGTLLHQTRVGVPFEEALRNLGERVGSEDLSLVVISVETARRTGGNLAEIFETISATIRERIRIRNRVRTLTAQGRMQGVVLSLMPLGIGLALHFLQPNMFGPFLRSSAGVATVAAVAVLLALGALSIRKIVNIDV